MSTEPEEILHAASRRWQRRKHARTAEILAAAAQIVEEKGWDMLRMADIARRAGITKGTIYLYYTNKDAVIRALGGIPAAMQPAELQAAE